MVEQLNDFKLIFFFFLFILLRWDFELPMLEKSFKWRLK